MPFYLGFQIQDKKNGKEKRIIHLLFTINTVSEYVRIFTYGKLAIQTKVLGVVRLDLWGVTRRCVPNIFAGMYDEKRREEKEKDMSIYSA